MKQPSAQSAPKQTYTAGDVFEFEYPFVYDPKDYMEFKWKPGVTMRDVGSGNRKSEANGIGAQILTVVSVHKPGDFPFRIFYTRKWRDPQGREFGNGKLHIRSQAAFTRLRGGYRYAVDRMIQAVTE